MILWLIDLMLRTAPYLALVFIISLLAHHATQYTGKKSWAHVVVDKQREILEETLVEIRAIRNLLEDEQKNHEAT